MRSSIIQTFICKKAATYLSDKLNTEVSVGGVDFELFRTFIIKDVFIRDLHKDTLIFAGELKLSIKNYNLKKNTFLFKNIEINNTRLNLVQYKNEQYLNFQFIVDAFETGDTSVQPKKTLNLWCRNFQLKNIDFSYKYEKDTTPNFGINYNDAHIKHLNASITNLFLDGDTLNAHVDNLTAFEKSGFRIKRFTSDIRISSIFMHYKNLDFSTNSSHVSTNLLRFEFKSWDDFNDYEEQVLMSAVFKRSIVELGDISYFAPELEGIKKMLTLSGDVHGTVSDLNGKKIKIGFGKNSKLSGDFSLNGLPYLKETLVHLKIDELYSNQSDLESIPTAPFTDNTYLKLPHNIERLGQMVFKGNFTGFYNDFVAYGTLNTKIGSISTDIQLKQSSTKQPVTYNGKLTSTNFDIGTYYGLEDVMRNITLDVDISGKGLNINNINADIKGKVASFEFRKYNYKNIDVKGNFAKNVFHGKFAVEDENVGLNFDGDIDLTGKYPYLNFKSEIRKADLANLNLFKTKNNINFSTIAEVKLTGDDIDNIAGSIKLNNTHFIQNQKSVDVGLAVLNSTITNSSRKLELFSDFADAEITGKYTFLDLEKAFKKMLASYLPAVVPKEDYLNKPTEQIFDFKLQTKESKALSGVLFENLVLYKNSNLSGNFNSQDNHFNFQFMAPEIEVSDRKLKDFEINSKTESSKLNISIKSKNLLLGDSNTVKNINFYALAADDSLKFRMQWVNDSRLSNKGKLSGYVSFSSLSNFNIHLNPSEIFIEDSLWLVDNSNLVTYENDHLLFTNFVLAHANQSLNIHGIVSKDNQDQLSIDLNNFNISILNPLLRKDDLNLRGSINGTATISGIYSNLIFSSAITFSNFALNNEVLGNGSVLSVWDNEKESIAINGKFLRGDIPTIAISGFYYPNKNENSLDFELSLQKTQLKLLESYTKDIISNIRGTATGDLFLSGSLKKPILNGSIEIQKGGFLVDYINTNYTFSSTLTFKNGEINVPPFMLYDINGNKAVVEGIVTHNYFNAIKFDFNLDAKKLFCLNTNSNQNSLYYGKAYASGLIKIFGDLKNVNFNIDAQTEKGTQFNIPLSGSEEISENKFVSFVNKKDSSLKVNNSYQVDLSGIQLNFDLEVTPDAEVQLIFDSKIGDVIKGNGTGNLKMQINTLGQFNMYGDYTINSGDYLFTLKNVINKRFKIDQGGTVIWNGDPYDAFVNLKAVYRVRTSLYELLQEEAYKQRVPVDCELKMTDKLFNPSIAFDINLPNSDERVKNEVKSAIGYENEAELNKQVFSLLVLGRFIPPTDVARNATTAPTTATNDFGVSSNSSELLSNQISNWLSQTNDLVKLGVKYRPGDEITNKELQVAVSTDLFNDRVSIDGNVGVANNPYAASNIVGDVNIEYKINKDGKFRVKAFNQSNDYTTIANNGPYKQGVGVFYREEFDTWGELIRRYRDKIRSLHSSKNKIAEIDSRSNK